MSAIAAVFLLASAPLAAADQADIDRATEALFAPYRRTQMVEAPWERDVWSNEIAHLITHWQSVVPEDEPDALNDGDWLCQCQDWDPAGFRMKIVSHKSAGPDVAEVEVDIYLGFGEPRDAFLEFRREEGAWRLDDLYSEPYPDGIKDGLLRTIVDDEALAH